MKIKANKSKSFFIITRRKTDSFKGKKSNNEKLFCLNVFKLI